MAKNVKRIGVLTGGGDCPGLNAVIRAVTKSAITEGLEVFGVEDGFLGLLEDRVRPLDWNQVSNILTLGGTILGTTNKANPFAMPVRKGGKLVEQDQSDRVLRTLRRRRLDGLVTIGGDGTQSCAARLAEKGVPVVGVPKTIDNDVAGTELTFGFDTAVATATDALDRLHTTASSHHRVMVLEVMGRNAGWIALHSGLAGGADVILIPEIAHRLDCIAKAIAKRKKRGKHFSLIVVAEGVRLEEGTQVIRDDVSDSFERVRLGGVGPVLADRIEEKTGRESRAVVLGHIQRGGSPTAFDRVLATQFGHAAAELILAGRWNRMAAIRAGRISSVPIKTPDGKQRRIPRNHPLLRTARHIGVSFGDE